MTQKIRKDPLWEDWLSMMTLTGWGTWFDWTRSLITWGFEKWQACPTIDVWNCHDKIKFRLFSHSGLWNCFSTIKWGSFRIFFDIVLSKHEDFYHEPWPRLLMTIHGCGKCPSSDFAEFIKCLAPSSCFLLLSRIFVIKLCFPIWKDFIRVVTWPRFGLTKEG